MLRAVPRGWFTRTYEIDENGIPAAVLRLTHLRESGELLVGETRYSLGRDGWFRGPFLLEKEGSVLARAEKTSWFTRVFEVDLAHRHYLLRPRSFFRRAYTLCESDREVGSVGAAGWWSRVVVAELPKTIGLPERAFLVWLYLIMRRRAAHTVRAVD